MGVDTMELPETSDTTSVIKKTQNKHYVCQICNKSFKDSYKLKRHEKVHIKIGELLEPTDFELQEEKVIIEKVDTKEPINATDINQKVDELFNQSWSESLNTMKEENPWD